MDQSAFDAFCDALLEATQDPLEDLRQLVVTAVGENRVVRMKKILTSQVKDRYQFLIQREIEDHKKVSTVCASARGSSSEKNCLCVVNAERKNCVKHSRS